MADGLQVNGLTRSFGKHQILSDLSFTVPKGEIFALLGLSGCGKSTTLNLIAGLDRPDAGEILLDGEVVCSKAKWTPPHQRKLGMVFQEQMLWPHMSVQDHLTFVLRAQNFPASKQADRIGRQLEAVRLTGRNDARPSELSGGERQRLSIARALVAEPSVLLLDEPCANLDAPLKKDFLELLARLNAEQQFTTVYVTHDPAEASYLAAQIGILDQGQLIQCSTAMTIHEKPNALAVARLVAKGVEFSGIVSEDGRIKTSLGPVEAEILQGTPTSGMEATLFVRDEDLMLDAEGNQESTVTRVHYQDGGYLALLEQENVSVCMKIGESIKVGSTVKWRWARKPWCFV